MKGGTVQRNAMGQWETPSRDQYSRDEASLLNILDLPIHITSSSRVWNNNTLDLAAYRNLRRVHSDIEPILRRINNLFLAIITDRIRGLVVHNTPALIRADSVNMDDDIEYTDEQLTRINADLMIDPNQVLINRQAQLTRNLGQIRSYDGHIHYLLTMFNAYMRFLNEFNMHEYVRNISRILEPEIASRRVQHIQQSLHQIQRIEEARRAREEARRARLERHRREYEERIRRGTPANRSNPKSRRGGRKKTRKIRYH
jgi:hypothetical protein